MKPMVNPVKHLSTLQLEINEHGEISSLAMNGRTYSVSLIDRPHDDHQTIDVPHSSQPCKPRTGSDNGILIKQFYNGLFTLILLIGIEWISELLFFQENNELLEATPFGFFT